MRRKKAARLPTGAREEIERLWREGRLTLDELMEFLRARGLDVKSDPVHGVSRSGLHRYLKSFGVAAERMREAQQIASAVVGKLSETARSDLRDVLIQLLSQIALYQLRAIEDEGATVKPSDLMLLARAVGDIEAAAKTSLDTRIKVRKQIATELTRKTAPALSQIDAAARGGGLSVEAAEAIRKAIAEIEI